MLWRLWLAINTAQLLLWYCAGRRGRLALSSDRLLTSLLKLMDQDRYSFPSPSARQTFGRTMTAWVNRNGWIHSTIQEWGQQAGFPAVRDSSFNRLQNAKTEQPSPLTFIQLAIANKRIADQDYSGVVDRQLKDRLKDSEPITDAKGKPWGAMEFFGHFVGELPAPEWALPPKLLTVEQAANLSREHQSKFEAIAKAKDVPPPTAWKQLEGHCKGLTNAQRDALRNVLSGWHTWTPEEWEAIKTNDSDPVDVALAAWSQVVDD